ncbi:hypothetical protein [Lentzea flava]|uniref:Uncharacterized protein n=1 Tax=Lentzea flava TaxID=103732 RepID=A0ABQ2UGD2_9PSEU|nr:hypothetical protein [Lentzea flava]MCP2198374.1 hypothetical protein [Lentzea flava]GGU25414.1 hypothetical protein GCM10010178_17000 [Lentzea flava]
MNSPRITELACLWRTAPGSGLPEPGGEFLGAMLDHFPELFPAWDYADLRERFAARFG